MKQMIQERHTVRKYVNLPLTEDLVTKLEERVAGYNQEEGLSMKLMVDDKTAFGPALKMFLAKDVSNYLILSAEDSSMEERLGYYGSDFCLYAQSLGLNTWWVAGTYSRRHVKKQADGRFICGLIAVGYGAEQGKPHKSREASEVSDYVGEQPEWFREGVEAALLAPTAMNRQAFHIIGEGNEVHITYAKGPFSATDRGIIKHHFEVGAGKENFILK